MIRQYARSLYVLTLLCFLAGVSYVTKFHVSLPLAKVQLFFFACIILLLSQLLRPLVTLTTKTLCLLIFVGVVVTGFTFSPLTLKQDTVFFAPYLDDENGAQTRIDRVLFQEALQRAQQRTSVSAMFDSVKTSDEALRLIDNRSHIKGVIWGSPRMLNVTYGSGLFSEEVPLRTWNKPVQGMRVITQPASVTFPYLPRKETLELLAASFSFDTASLREAGQVVARWRAHTLRALVFFRLGTITLQRILNEQAAPAHPVLEDAIASLRTAYKFAPGEENRQLRRIILSNLAVALSVEGFLLDQKEPLREARNLMLDAARVTRYDEKNDQAFIDSRLIQRQNSDVLRMILRD
jgi:hypothetical protein